MIAGLVEQLGRTVDAADFVESTEQRLSVTVDDAGDVAADSDAAHTVHVRVLSGGRMGWAGGQSARAADVGSAAMRSATGGPVIDMLLPAPAPVPAVRTAEPAAVGANLSDLVGLARSVRDRLRGRDRRVEVWAERLSGAVGIANTRGVTVEFPRSVIGVGVVARTGWGADRPPLRTHVCGVGLPGLEQLEGLVAGMSEWLDLPELDHWPNGRTRALLEPRAVRTILGPVLSELNAGTETGRELALAREVTLTDDPLADARPGSRPICDDGVPTRAIPLLVEGQPRRRIVDLTEAARRGVPATGHGVRTPLGAPRAGYSNIRMAPGAYSSPDLRKLLNDGVLVLDLPWGPTPSRSNGNFRSRAPWTVAFRDGEPVGRLADAVLSGNAFDLLTQVAGVGTSPSWLGSWQLPRVVVDGLLLGGPAW